MTDEAIVKQFAGAGDFIRRELRCADHILYAYAIDGLISGGDAADYVLKPISRNLQGSSMDELYHNALHGSVYNTEASPCKDLPDVYSRLVNGFCVVLFSGVGAIAYEVRTGVSRTPSAPEVENTVKGPKDAFVETLRINTSLIRRHLRTPDLKLYQTTVGRRSLTNVTVIWIQGITNQDLVERMKRRLAAIDVDGFLSPSAVEEYMTGSRATAFPLLQYTERPDKFSQALLDGRVGLVVDGLPLGYMAPVDLGYLMESPEDKSRDYLSASFVRILRYGALGISLLLPAIYTAMVTFHLDWIPEALRNIIVQSRDGVPFHTVSEAIGLLIAYELLQESGIHLPQAIGQSVSTIGGIVVGTAAVEAGLISPIVLIVVSIAGVCGFVLPNRDLAQAVRLWRLLICLVAGFLGIYGVAAAFLLLILHLAGMRSLGVPYLRIKRGRGKGILRRRLREETQRDPGLKPEDERTQK